MRKKQAIQSRKLDEDVVLSLHWQKGRIFFFITAVSVKFCFQTQAGCLFCVPTGVFFV